MTLAALADNLRLKLDGTVFPEDVVGPASFDIVGHSVLIHQLGYGIGIKGPLMPTVKQPCCLPVCFQIQLKVLGMTFKALRNLGPTYWKVSLHPYVLVCPLQLSGNPLLAVLLLWVPFLASVRALRAFPGGVRGACILGDFQEALRGLWVCCGFQGVLN